jgi:hypothetical protein
VFIPLWLVVVLVLLFAAGILMLLAPVLRPVLIGMAWVVSVAVYALMILFAMAIPVLLWGAVELSLDGNWPAGVFCLVLAAGYSCIAYSALRDSVLSLVGWMLSPWRRV